MKYLLALLWLPSTLSAQIFTTPFAPVRQQLSVTHGTSKDTAKVIIVEQSAITPWVQEKFNYSNTSQWLTNPLYSSAYGNLALDTTSFSNQLYAGRYSTIARPNSCAFEPLGRDIILPNETQEIWIEVWAKFEIGFTAQIPWGCYGDSLRTNSYGTTMDYGFVVGRLNSLSGAFMFATHSCHWTGNCIVKDMIPSSSNISDLTTDKMENENYAFLNHGVAITSHWYKAYPTGSGNPWPKWPNDGQWHRLRIYWKATGAGATGVRIPYVSIWLDKDFIGWADYATVYANGLIGVGIGRGFTHGPSRNQSLWIGSIKIWNTNPGW